MSANILSRNGPAISEATVLLHAMIPASRANGPGLRAVVFFQGCTLGCEKCFNPTTHVFQGVEVAPEKVVAVAATEPKKRSRQSGSRQSPVTSRQSKKKTDD